MDALRDTLDRVSPGPSTMLPGWLGRPPGKLPEQ